jgi:hypothetical protein
VAQLFIKLIRILNPVRISNRANSEPNPFHISRLRPITALSQHPENLHLDLLGRFGWPAQLAADGPDTQALLFDRQHHPSAFASASAIATSSPERPGPQIAMAAAGIPAARPQLETVSS